MLLLNLCPRLNIHSNTENINRFYSIFFGIVSHGIEFFYNPNASLWIFAGFSGITWLTIFVQALGGILVALIVKLADNIIKGFATGAAIVLTNTLGYYWMNSNFSLEFVVGASCVVLSIFNYNEF